MHTTRPRPAPGRSRRTLVSLAGLLVTAPALALVPTGSASAGLLPDPCDPLVILCPPDITPPETTIQSGPTQPGATTSSSSASFTFTATESDGTTTSGASFACQLTGPGRPGGFSSCGSPQSYTGLGPGDYTFSVQATDSSGNTDQTPASFSWHVANPDTTPPETTITSGPGGWLLDEYAVYGYSASEPASAFACHLDATPSECGGDKELVAGFASGTHTFAVAATDGAGNQDPTPATRTFTMPKDDRALTRSKGWSKRTGSGYLRDTYCTTTQKGAKLTTKAGSIRKVALVVGKGKGYGTVKVMLGKKVLKKVSLASRKTKKRALVEIAAFTSPRSAKISVVVVSSGKKVVVDGIGLATG